MEPEPWGVGRSRRLGVGKASSLLLVPHVRKGETGLEEADRVEEWRQPTLGGYHKEPGPPGLTWIKGYCISIIAIDFQAEGKVGWSPFRAVGGSNTSCLPFFAPEGCQTSVGIRQGGEGRKVGVSHTWREMG